MVTGLDAHVMANGSEWGGANKLALLLAWNVCSGGRIAILECTTEVNEKDGEGSHWVTGALNQDILQFDVMVNVVVQVQIFKPMYLLKMLVHLKPPWWADAYKLTEHSNHEV